MKKIKVLQVCYSLKAAGIETFVANLQENTDTSIIENHMLIYKDSEKDFFYKDIVINNGGIIENASDHSKNFLLRHIKQRFNFYKIIRKIDFDIIHVHASSGLQGLEVFLAKKFGDAKVVVHSHSSNLSLSSKFNWLKKIINQIGLKYIRNNSDLNLACSDKAAKWLFGCNEYFLVNNGINIEKYYFDENIRNKVRINLGISDEDFVIGHIGSFSEIKNHAFLIDVFCSYLSSNPNSYLLMIGDGPLKERIAQKVREKNIENNVFFLGVRDDCNELLMGMDSFVFPSLWEGLPITIIEAQASGLNCYLSDTITKQVNISNYLTYISLELEPSFWASKIKRVDRDRDEAIYQIKKMGFDMNSTTKMLENKYKELINYEN